MSEKEPIVGIDLGTTNSEIAAFVGGSVRVIGRGETNMLPSCVGISPEGELLIGQAARNQQLIYPERTIRSIKRKMGSSEPTDLGGKKFMPQEISALILRELCEWAKAELGVPARKAVITVPAYFSDAQRQATREAGALAGLEVVRIVNEPTAASLAYGYGGGPRRTVMVYDLGGGTFDVSIVTIESDVTEVLGSHGNNHLGGDDFNDLLLDRLLDEFREQHHLDLRDGHPAAYSRLWWAAEEIKKTLSREPYATLREEALAVKDGVPLHLELELSRTEFEDMIRPLVDSTIESVAKAMADAGKRPGDLDAVLLVGGSTRIPLISRIIEERTGMAPEHRIHPDLCVALGAGVLAARLSGEEVEQVLVDVSPYSFGPSYLGERDGLPYLHCYHPIIERNTPLPVTRTDTYCTASPYQREVEVRIYQGDDPDALKNTPVGNFTIEGLMPIEEPNEVLCRMSLDLDGILNVTAIEKKTGKTKHVAIRDALVPKSKQEVEEARRRLEDLFALRADTMDDETDDDLDGDPDGPRDVPFEVDEGPAVLERTEEPGSDRPAGAGPTDPEWEQLAAEAVQVSERARALFEKMHPDDREEAIGLNESLDAALKERDRATLARAVGELKEILFFVEGS